ncbi:TonB-dependent receptor domain-containing protein [Sphingomonas sp. 37zxx]|uniref:TonB-dependent receptor domain-containing protein n=1 Tax=Sphingomonas sp. 37zxx TaxID=1550073 RepID=UPI00053BDE41|nr:TonB-dependent receptor [Sphingomonas sp. 37zxx]
MRAIYRHKLLTSAAILGAVAVQPAYANDVAENAPTVLAVAAPVTVQETDQVAEEQQESIVITGSRIRRADISSTSPLAIVSAEEFKLSGAVNVEQVINTLPQVIPGVNQFSNNPGGGVSELDLRGLGAQRTLVLVNGRRYMFHDTSQVVDLNTIPAFLLRDVQVQTGGGSAVYGSDALAGVVNFNLRTDLEGLEVGTQYSITERGDGSRFNVNMALGTQLPDNRGHVTIYGEYNKRGSIFQSARDFSRFALGDSAGNLIPQGSAGVPQGRFVASPTITVGAPGSIGGANASCGGTGQPPRNAGCFTIAEGTNYPGAGAFFGTPGTSTPYNAANNSYNFAPDNFLMVPQERWMIGGYGEYEVTKGVTAYAEFTYINNRVQNELAPTPITQNVDFQLSAIQGLVSANDFAQLSTIATNQQAAIAAAAACGVTAAGAPVCGNPFGAFTAGTGQFGALQPGSVRLQVNSRTNSINSRNVEDDRSAYRVLAGFKGEILNSLNYDAYYMYSRTRNASVQLGNVSRSAFTRLAANGTCNVFGERQLSDACVDQISILAQNGEISELEVANASVSGPLFNLPTSSAPVQFAAGVEWRRMGSRFIPDTALSSGDVVGFNAGQPTQGSYTSREAFGELVVPLVTDNFIHSLELDGSFRYSDYSLEAVGGVWAYSGGVKFAPIRDIMFCGQYQRAIRAPNVGELFGGQSVGFPQATDHCATAAAAAPGPLRDVCIATGVPASNVGQNFLQPNPQVQGAFGGNPNLTEETADTYTAGVVLQPRFIPGLTVQVDYYNITIDKAVSEAGGGVANILNLCYLTIQNANSALCGLISRDTQGVISGPPFVVQASEANLASLEVEGIDFQADFTTRVGFGLLGEESRLNFNFLATYTLRNNTTPLVDLPDDIIECAGKYGVTCLQPTPIWKWTGRVSFTDGPLLTSVRWRHVGATEADSPAYVVQNIDAYSQFDLTFAMQASDNLTLTAGINNLFDKQPPVLGAGAQQANTFPGVFDVLGRDFFVSAQMRF